MEDMKVKKMSDVFELPINHEFLEVYGPERAGIPYTEAEKHAAHAINHADALADALEAVLPYCQGRTKEQIDAWAAAKDALAAYRGEA